MSRLQFRNLGTIFEQILEEIILNPKQTPDTDVTIINNTYKSEPVICHIHIIRSIHVILNYISLFYQSVSQLNRAYSVISIQINY